jgi:hypothetical protein
MENNNKLIAEFMGLEEIYTPLLNIYEISETETCLETDLAYHTDWNWLMPVVEKIEHIDSIDVNILTNGTRIYEWRSGGKVIIDNSADISFSNKIEHTYHAVVEFIKWYNENK